jgi:hypothetical protein
MQSIRKVNEELAEEIRASLKTIGFDGAAALSLFCSRWEKIPPFWCWMQGCQIVIGAKYQKWGKNYKMTAEYTQWP